MAIWQGKSLRKPSGARAKTNRNKRNMEFGRDPADTKIGDRKIKIIRTKAVTRKVRLANEKNINVVTRKQTKYKLQKS